MAQRQPSVLSDSRAIFSPNFGIVWDRRVSVYCFFHEWEHVSQFCERRLLWRAWEAWWTVPHVRNWLRLLIELDAARRALWRLARCGILRWQDIVEAGIRFFS